MSRIEQVEQIFGIQAQRKVHMEEELGLISLPNGKGHMLFTTSLGDYAMPVPQKYKDEERIELYLLLPSYWEVNDHSPLLLWAMSTLVAIVHYLKNKKWAIRGHTFSIRGLPEGKLKEANFEAFLLIEPLLLEELHQAIQIPEGKIHFKALCPIFRNEKDLKAAKGVERFVNRLKDKGVNEQVDEFRRSTVKSRFLFWK